MAKKIIPTVGMTEWSHLQVLRSARFGYAPSTPVYQNFFKAGDEFNIPTPNTQGIFSGIIGQKKNGGGDEEESHSIGLLGLRRFLNPSNQCNLLQNFLFIL
jgi:hypothetical protein